MESGIISTCQISSSFQSFKELPLFFSQLTLLPSLHGDTSWFQGLVLSFRVPDRVFAGHRTGHVWILVPRRPPRLDVGLSAFWKDSYFGSLGENRWFSFKAWESEGLCRPAQLSRFSASCHPPRLNWPKHPSTLAHCRHSKGSCHPRSLSESILHWPSRLLFLIWRNPPRRESNRFRDFWGYFGKMVHVFILPYWCRVFVANWSACSLVECW